MDKRVIISVAAGILVATGIILFGVFYGGGNYPATDRAGELISVRDAATDAPSDSADATATETEDVTETVSDAEDTKDEDTTEVDPDKEPTKRGKLEAQAKIERANAVMKLREDLAKFDFEEIAAQLRAHTKEYPDTRGWIYVTDTNISFPIVQGTDNDFYLDHSAEKYYTEIGSIFADYRNSKDIWSDFNTVIYGHNVWFGGMFHDIEKFLTEGFFTSHNVYIFTLDGLYVYQPFTIFKADWGYKYFHPYIELGDDWVSFAREMRDNSRFPQDVDFLPEDHILTVSTCTNGPQTERWSFQSKRTAELDYGSVGALILRLPHNYRDLYADLAAASKIRP